MLPAAPLPLVPTRTDRSGVVQAGREGAREAQAGERVQSIGIRVHSGWGALVAVSGEPGATQVIDRRHLEIVDRELLEGDVKA